MRQLRQLGISDRSVHHRAAVGRLHRVHRGVYAVGHRIVSVRGRWMAAVLAAGPGAVLSHRSAAALWDLSAGVPAAVDVIAPTRARSRPGLRVHRHRLPADEATVVDGIPVTSLARTLLDLAGVTNRRGVERAVDMAETLRLLDVAALQVVLERHPTQRGTRIIRRVLADHALATTLTRSELEERFLSLCDRARLPRPELNVAIALPDGGKATVDALWRAERLVVEVDGQAAHATRAAQEWDRHRDVQLALAGYEVLRFTGRQVARAPERVVAGVEAIRRRRADARGRP